MRIDTGMFNGYLFFMGVGVGILFWCVLKLIQWNQSFFWNFWGPPNLSASCDNNHSYFKHESSNSVIFGRYKMIKKPLGIHEKLFSDALAPSKKKIASGAGLWQLCEAFASIAGVPIVCQILPERLLTYDAKRTLDLLRLGRWSHQGACPWLST